MNFNSYFKGCSDIVYSIQGWNTSLGIEELANLCLLALKQDFPAASRTALCSFYPISINGKKKLLSSLLIFEVFLVVTVKLDNY